MATLNNRYGGLITNGLGLSACNGLIVNFFGVTTCFEIRQPTTSGGAIPLMPGEIQTLYQPIEGKPVDPSVYDKKVVKITVKIGKLTSEKEFLVSNKKASYMISVVNLVNSTKDRMKVTISNLQRTYNKLMVHIKNLKVKTNFDK